MSEFDQKVEGRLAVWREGLESRELIDAGVRDCKSDLSREILEGII